MINYETANQANFFNKSSFVQTRRRLSTYLRIFEIPRKKLYKLHGKKILLIGGGNSPIKQTFNRLKINCNITNVDPYIINPQTAHTNIKLDFTKTTFTNEFDEIWALYSLPLYSPNIEHAVKFYLAAIIALKPGGILRIGGHPRTIDSWLAAPIHFPCNTLSINLLDMYLDEIYGLKIKQYLQHDEYIAPKRFAQKQKLNERLSKHK